MYHDTLHYGRWRLSITSSLILSYSSFFSFHSSGTTCEANGMFTCDSGTCVSRDKICDFSDDCLDASDESYGMCSAYKFRCDFEAGLCGTWAEEVTDSADWVLLRGSSDTLEMLPAYDHTSLSSSGTT